MKSFILAAALGALTIGSAASAIGTTDVRQANQERRIDAGLRSGKLTKSEAASLKAEQRSIKALERDLRARHGHLTPSDKRLIKQRQDAADRHILGQKHDGQRGRNHLKI